MLDASLIEIVDEFPEESAIVLEVISLLNPILTVVVTATSVALLLGSLEITVGYVVPVLVLLGVELAWAADE